MSTVVKYGTLITDVHMLDRCTSNDYSITSVDKQRQMEAAISTIDVYEKETKRRKSRKRKESIMLMPLDAEEKPGQEV